MSGSTSHILTLAMYVIVADGLVALLLGGLLGPLGLAVVGAAAMGSFWQAWLRAPLAHVRGGATVPGLIAAVASLVDLVYFAPSVLDGLIHLLLVLLLYRLYTRETLRDVRDIGFICFFMLVAAAPGTFDVGFLFVFIAFLFAATALLMLRHVLGESGIESSALVVGSVPILGRQVIALTLVASVATLVITATLFFVIPRIGQAALPLRAKVGRMVSGFSERVSLGSFGEIETDAAVIMRVHVPEGIPSPDLLPGVRWRGIALDHFDGRVWTRDDPERYGIRRTPGGTFELARPRGGGVLLAQEIYLEPLGTDVVFGAPRMLRLSLRAEEVTLDAGGSVAAAAAAARLRYVAESELESVPPRPSRRPEELDQEARARYLQLPPIAPRVAALAGDVAGRAAPLEAAQRLTAHLSQQYRYSRVLERKTELAPVEEFLFVSRSGNCEYFAASLAVMLRTLGIPARVVNGFQRGEWNPYGRYFMVRLLDAHSWVEAFIEDFGWVTLDPSPRGAIEMASAPGPVNLYLDALRMRWYRYVVNWSLTDQVQAAGSVRHAAKTWSPRFEWLLRRPDVRRGTLALAAISALVVLAVFGLRHPRLRARFSRDAMPRFYVRALRALARRGLVPERGETAREFVARVTRVEPALTAAFVALTGGYERVRFGGETLSSRELVVLDRCVAALAPVGRVTTPLIRKAPFSRTIS